MLNMIERKYSNIAVMFILFGTLGVRVIGEESNANFGNPNPGEVYLPVFRNIPVLFEYLLETLEERPEILEKNDIAVFKRNAEIKSTRYKRLKEDIKEKGYDNYQKWNRESFRSVRQSHDSRENEENSKVSSDEVAEQALRVEKLLEEYNKG